MWIQILATWWLFFLNYDVSDEMVEQFLVIRVIVIYIMPDSVLIDSINHTNSNFQQSSTPCRHVILCKDNLLKVHCPPKKK